MRVNLGSGQRRFEGWVNIDIVSRPDQQPDVIADGALLPLPSNSVQTIVLSHTLEHFHLGDANTMLEDCHRTLTPGGSLIITVPNMKTLAKRWLLGQIEDYIFFVNTYGAWQGEEGDDHHWGFSHQSLVSYLTSLKIKWRSVQSFNWREIPGASIARDWWICAVEAVK